MKRLLTAIAVLAVIILGGTLAFRHFVTDQIMDLGGMENPDYAGEPQQPEMLDGDGTYVDNEALLNVIAGTWVSEDERYVLTLQDDCRILLTRKGETVLDGQIYFTYLQPGEVQRTEFSLDSCRLGDDSTSAAWEISSLYHESGDDSGRICMEVVYADGSSEMIKFEKAADAE